MEVAQPHSGVVAEKSAHLLRSSLFKIRGAAPRRLMSIRKIRTEFTGVIPARTEVVIYHIEQHGQAKPVRSIDEPLQCVRTAVGLVHSIERNTVITPSVIAIERCNGHQFNMSDAELSQIFKLRNCGVKSALRCEGSNVQFIDDCAG